MSEKEKSEKAQAQILRDAFEGMKGRQPRSDRELNEWLATDEGKEATIFEATSLSTWVEHSSSLCSARYSTTNFGKNSFS